MTLSAYRQGMSDIGIDQFYGPYSLKHAAISKLFKLGLELAQVNNVARYALNSTMALVHYNPTSTNKKALQLLSSMSSVEKEPIQLEKQPIYEEPSISQEEDEYKTLFGDDQEIEKIVKKIQEKEQKQKEADLMVIKQEQELAKEKIQNLKQQLINEE
jgi:Tfp pilus assembly protein FimV